MMQRRDCAQVINEMLEFVPKDKLEFIGALEWNIEDSLYKAPEETLQWFRTSETLAKYIPVPVEDWEFQVCSIFTTKTIDELKEIVKQIILEDEIPAKKKPVAKKKSITKKKK